MSCHLADGQVVRMSIPGQVSGGFEWRRSSTLDIAVSSRGISVQQDGRVIASKTFAQALTPPPGPFTASTCGGLFGSCPVGASVTVHGLQG